MGLLHVPLISGTLTKQEAQSLEQLGQHHVVILEANTKRAGELHILWSLLDKTRTALEQILRRNRGSLHSGKPRTMVTSHLQTGKSQTNTKPRNQTQNQRIMGRIGSLTRQDHKELVQQTHTSQEKRFLPGK